MKTSKSSSITVNYLSWWRVVVGATFLFHGFCSSERGPNYSFLHDATTAPQISYYDYIIVGGGTAGCPLAATLSHNTTVLLLERGGSPYGNPNITLLSAFGAALSDLSPSSPSQRFISEDGVINARARVLGGGSCLNAGFYTRAAASEVQDAGWDPRLVNESYRWVEEVVAFQPPMRGWQSAVRDGLVQAGIRPYNGFTFDHINGTKVGGTIFDSNGNRHTAADLLRYANPAGISVLLHATVHKVLFKTHGVERPQAHGVLFTDSQGIEHRAYLTRGPKSEIIISAGSLGSPQLLMLSGVGPADQLKAHNISLVLDQPEVGQGMSDNPMNAIYIPSPQPVEISLIQVVGITPFGSYIEAASGENFNAGRAHAKDFGMLSPKIGQLSSLPPKQRTPEALAEAIQQMSTLPDIAFQGGFILEKTMGPISKGHLELTSLDPNDNPSVTFNYFKESQDLERCVKGLQTIENVINSQAFSKFKYDNMPIQLLLNMTARGSLNLLPHHSNVTTSLEQFCKDTVMTIWHYHGGNLVGKVVDRDYNSISISSFLSIFSETFIIAIPMAIRVSLLLLLFLTSFLTVFSLYEDQVGLMDWHQQYLGKVKQAVFHTQKAGRKRLVVSTEESVVASLDLRRGEIFWRHVLGEKDPIDHIDIALGKYVITLSSKGSIVRAWNLPDGQMVWESSLVGKKPSGSSLLTVIDLKVERDNVILVYSNGCLHAISSIDGAVLWNLELENVELQQLIQPASDDVVYAVGYSSSSKLHAYGINIKTGELIVQDMVDFPGGVSGELSPISREKFVSLNADHSVLVTIILKDGKISLQKENIHNVVPQYSGRAALLPVKVEGMFAVKCNSYVVLVRLNENNKLEVVDKFEDSVTFSDAISHAEEKQAFGTVQQSGSNIHLTVKLGHDYSTDLLKEIIQIDDNRGLVQKVFINNYIRTDKSHGFRALVVMEDHSLLLLQQGNVVWSRDDGLASIVDVTTSELPLEKKGVSVAKVEQGLLEWLKGHMLKLKGTLMLASPEDMAAIQALRLKSSEKSKMTRDHNGFRKLLIVLTKAGKVYALHTGDGRVVWSVFLPNLRKSETCENPVAVNLYQWQVPHHHAMDENPAVLVVGHCGNGIDAPGILSVVDTYLGKELNSLGPTHSIANVIALPFADSTEKRLHLIIDADKNVHLYPKTSEAAAILEREFSNVYWYSVDAENNILQGHALKRECKSEIADEFCFSSRALWSIVLPSDSEKIIATASRISSEVVHTQAKVMGDRDVMYKYISKNLLFVATVAPQAAGEIGSVGPDESSLVVYLIDVVTGRILHRVTHLGSQGPVRAVFSENWVVYHYFNLRAHRYEMSVIELYDQSRADNKNVWKLIIGKHNLTSPISSYSRPEILTKSQTFFFAHSVKTISVTLTAKGITAKQLLIGTIGDQVLALDKRFVDPRRSPNPTPAELEEGLIPLTDTLPINPQSYVTHALKVEGLRGIFSVPAKLESTTLVFAYGADLFFTRLAPSKTYDSLTEDFSYALLLLTIVALVAAIFVTWILSERKELNDKWR